MRDYLQDFHNHKQVFLCFLATKALQVQIWKPPENFGHNTDLSHRTQQLLCLPRHRVYGAISHTMKFLPVASEPCIDCFTIRSIFYPREPKSCIYTLPKLLVKTWLLLGMPKWRYFIILLFMSGVPLNTVTEGCEARKLRGRRPRVVG